MIRASLILALAWLACRLIKNRPAAERHLLWVTALATASLLPALILIVPSWRPELAGRIAAAIPSLSQSAPIQRAQEAGGAIVHAVGIEPAGGIEFLLVVVWIAGAAVILGRLLPGARAVRRLASFAHPLPEKEWTQILSHLTQTLDIKRKVRLLCCPHSSLPLTWGFLRPQILLPRDAAHWSDSRKFAVLAHELAHIRRGDWLFQILAETVCALYWFHPLFWVARNRLHLESERACDDAVIRLGVEGREYAQHLLDIARSLKRKEPSWSLAMAGQLHLERRLVAALNPAINRRAPGWKAALGIVLPLLCCVLPIAAIDLPAAPAVLLYTVPPLYSDEARRERVEGVVEIEARIDRKGQPHDLRVVRGLGFGLDENALLAVRNWKFAPGSSVTQVNVEFSLQTAELNEMIANDMVTAVGPGVVPPRIVHRVEARHQKHGGRVLLDVVIQYDGTPRVLRVVRSLSWEMDEAAIAALEQWRFSPARMDNVPVKVRMNVEMALAPLEN
jgi:TonB family protein